VRPSGRTRCFAWGSNRMEPAALRYAILRAMEQHEATGTSAYLDDKDLAARLRVALGDVQRQLLILENRQLVDLAKTFGPSYGARLTPNSMEALEAAAEQQPEPNKRAIGF
jgi:hypothetical protein